MGQWLRFFTDHIGEGEVHNEKEVFDKMACAA